MSDKKSKIVAFTGKVRKTEKTCTVKIFESTLLRLERYRAESKLSPTQQAAISTAVDEWLDREEAKKKTLVF